MTWTPETNRVPFVLLTEEEKDTLKACKHGWELYISDRWEICEPPVWWPHNVYRAKPAPKRLVTWHNVYTGAGFGFGYASKRDADLGARATRLCVYRIERNEDGSDPQIFVEEV